jgi:opacity protein-like surface antigen
MKKLLLILCLILAFSSYAQTTRKYNSLLERYEFYNSNGQLTGYTKYNSLQERWEFFNSNNQMYAYSKYNSLTGETEYIELNNNNNSVNYIIHDYGTPTSTFDVDLAMLALRQRQQQYDRAMSIYNSLSPEQKIQLDEYINQQNKRKITSYYEVSATKEGNLYKNTLGVKNVFDEFIDRRIELMYQIRTTKFARVEFSFGMIEESGQEVDYESYRFATTYQWVGQFIGNLNMYVGLGLAGKKINSKNNFNNNVETINGFYGLLVSNFGLDYNFKFPLILFLDYEFALSILPSGGISDAGFGIGLRYGF